MIAVVLSVVTGGVNKWTPEQINHTANMFFICIAILPIWYGIRQCANELEKIRKQLEKKE